jgi:hypothetical protein
VSHFAAILYILCFVSPFNHQLIECDSGERIFDTQGSDIEFKDDGGEMLTVGGIFNTTTYII